MAIVLPPVPPVDPITTGYDIVAAVVDIVGALFGGIFGGSANDNIIKAFDGLRDQMVKMVNAALRFAWKIAEGLAALYELVKDNWYKWISKLVHRLEGAIKKIYRTLHDILEPMMDAIRRQRKQLLDFYNQFIKPLITFIEKIRKIIHILQLFHIHIFDKLDAKLGRLELVLMTPVLRALYRLNTLGNWISYILNSSLLIYRQLFLSTLGASQNGVFNMLSNVPNYGFAELPPAPAAPAAPAPLTASAFVLSLREAQTEATPALDDPTGELATCWKNSIPSSLGEGDPLGDTLRCLGASLGA